MVKPNMYDDPSHELLPSPTVKAPSPSPLIIHSLSNGEPTNEYPPLDACQGAPHTPYAHCILIGLEEKTIQLAPIITKATVCMFHSFRPLLNPIIIHICLISVWFSGALCTKEGRTNE